MAGSQYYSIQSSCGTAFYLVVGIVLAGCGLYLVAEYVKLSPTNQSYIIRLKGNVVVQKLHKVNNYTVEQEITVAPIKSLVFASIFYFTTAVFCFLICIPFTSGQTM